MKRIDPSATPSPRGRDKIARQDAGVHTPDRSATSAAQHNISLDLVDAGTSPQPPTIPRAPSADLRQPVARRDKITPLFHAWREHWLESPLSAKWERPDAHVLGVLKQVNGLYYKWSKKRAPPFSPRLNMAALSTVSLLRKMGLPWFTNGILPPRVLPGNWPLHFKAFEQAAVTAKGRRVGDANADGYVCSESEAHHACIRALAQQTRADGWEKSPTVVSSEWAHEGVAAAAESLGLEHEPLPVNKDGGVDAHDLQDFLEMHARTNPDTPIVFAASVGNENGAYDDLRAVHAALTAFTARTGVPAYIHLDASRSFDDLTTMDEATRRRLGLPAFHLGNAEKADSIPVATIAAGGMNASYPAKVVALKPLAVGDAGRQIDYVMGPDSTVSGSRDALAGLIVAFQEERFGVDGMRALYAQSRALRDALADGLRQGGYNVQLPAGSRDVIFTQPHGLTDAFIRQWGLERRPDGAVVLSVQPGAQAADMQRLLQQLAPNAVVEMATPLQHQAYQVPDSTLQTIKETVDHWRTLSRHSAGYPGNQATYSVLGGVMGRMLSKAIPQEWVDATARALTNDLKQRLGVRPAEMGNYQGGIVYGSTKGNGAVLGTALARKQYPRAHVYYSEDTHYSAPKVLGDNARVTRQNEPGEGPHFRVIPSDEMGRMDPEAFAQSLVEDRARAEARARATGRAEPFQVILVCNFGTTFRGATDNLQALFDAAEKVGVRINFVHGDGALNFGAGVDSVRLGPPGSPARGEDGRTIINGCTVSNHKFPGLVVSAQTVAYVPPGGRMVGLDTHADPRAVFELWLYRQLVTKEDLAAERAYCMDNAATLRHELKEIGVETLYNADSFVTLLARQPPWFVNGFHLSPEKDWLHFITMPHVNTDTVKRFARALKAHKTAVDQALAPVSAAWTAAFGQPITVRPLECRPVTVVQHGKERKVDQLAQVRALLDRNDQSAVSDEFLRAWARGAMCFVAHDANDNVVGAYLLEAKAEQLPDRLDRRVEPMIVSADAGLYHADDARANAQWNAIGTDALQAFLDRLVNAGVIDGQS